MAMRRRGALLGSTGLAWMVIGGPALAGCQPAVANGAVIACSGLDAVGIAGGAATAVTATVAGGATVNPAVAGVSIALGSASAVANAGLIVNGNAGTGQATGVDVSFGTGSRVDNTGVIAAANAGVGGVAAAGILIGDGNTVANSGLVQATLAAAPGGAAIGIGNGTLALGSGSVIVNSGTIAASTDGSLADAWAIVLQGDGNVIANSGTILGLGLGGDEGRGIMLFGLNNQVTNSGVIRATSGDCCGIGIDLSGTGTVTNSGTIIGIATGSGDGYGVSAPFQSAVFNTGTISGNAVTGTAAGVALFSSGFVVNAGRIEGATVDGIAAGVLVFPGGGGNLIVNSGTVAARSTGVGLAIGISGFFLDTIVNSGTVEAVATGGSPSFAIQVLGGATISNLGGGRIVADSPFGTAVALSGAGNTLINQGLIRANGAFGQAIELDADSNTVVNAGLIQATDPSGAAIAACACAFSNTVINDGTIDGRIVLSSGFGSTVTNNGLITISAAGAGALHAISGDFAQSAGGTLALRVNAAAVADSLSFSGAAALGGTLRAVVQPGLYADSQTYVGMVAGGTVAGAFAQLRSSSVFLAPSAAYLPDRVDLTLTRIPFGAVSGETANQRAVGNALEGFYSPGLTGDAATIYGQLFAAGSVAVLDSLSGEAATGVQNPSFAAGGAFLSAVLGQAARWRADGAGGGGVPAGTAAVRVQLAAAGPLAVAQASVPGGRPWPPRGAGPRWSAWAAGFGLGGAQNGDGGTGSARLGYSMGGGAFGADAEIAPGLLLGGAVGAAGSSFSLDGRPASGDARTILFSLYGGWTRGPLYADAAFSYGHAQFGTTRFVTAGAISERAVGTFNGQQVGGRGEAGWRFSVGRNAVSPFAGVAVQALRQDGYSEVSTSTATGAAGLLGLAYQPQANTSVRSFLGVQAATSFTLGDVRVSPQLRLAWAHEFTATRQVTASFLAIPAAAFTVDGARPARDAAVVGAGVDVVLGRGIAVFAQFDGDLSGVGNAFAGSGGLRMSW